jgi:multimeric flavodoxin WrbA
MNAQKQVFLLVGSMRGTKSTSEYVGNRLLDALGKKGFSIKKMRVSDLLGSEGKLKSFLSCVEDSDLVVFSSPLYIDSEPYLVVKAMEVMSRHISSAKNSRERGFLVISNGGYPESRHNDTAISIYKNFALSAGFKWLGGLSMGMGAALTVPVFRRFSRSLRNMERALLKAAEDIDSLRPVSSEIMELFARPLMPIRLYSFLARGIARFFSITNGAWDICRAP